MSRRAKRWGLALASPFLVVAWSRALLWMAGFEWGEKVAVISLIFAMVVGALSAIGVATIEAEEDEA